MLNEIDRLPENFKTDLAKVYAGAKHSGVIPDGRRTHIVGETVRLRAKYNQKIMNLRASQAACAVDDVERQLTHIENEYAATLTNAA